MGRLENGSISDGNSPNERRTRNKLTTGSETTQPAEPVSKFPFSIPGIGGRKEVMPELQQEKTRLQSIAPRLAEIKEIYQKAFAGPSLA
ncbi:MAG TPA: hypothetical protein VE090_06240 [Methylomirabilota bacterium]|nr:hypothetical protein [Methylomirabilota bacterium]